MKILNEKISVEELKAMAKGTFGDMVKAVVDVERGIMAIGGELHSDEEAILLERDSELKNLWGINLYPELSGEDFIEFDSMINLRPSQNNRSRSVDDLETQKMVVEIVNRLIER